MSPNYLARNGWSKRTLKAGDKVKLEVHPLKDGRKGGFMVSVTLPDGTMHVQPAAAVAMRPVPRLPLRAAEFHEHEE